MQLAQPGILAPIPRVARYVTFDLDPGPSPGSALQALARTVDGKNCVVGIGEPLLRALKCRIDGMRPFPYGIGTGFAIPATPAALWCWMRGEDRGELLHFMRAIEHDLDRRFRVVSIIDSFRYGSGRDLTGYEDGTENPRGKRALRTALVSSCGAGLDGSTFVAVQQWLHDLDRFDAMPGRIQDQTIGRRRSDNREIENAPPSAHVRRTSQESYSPEAFVLRRSMPWVAESRAGLVFVAFGKSLDAFEALLRRMTGAEDGISDALFTFTRPVTGAYFWCPPMRRGRLDLRALGL